MGLGIQKRRKEAGDGNRDIVKNREKLFGQIMRRYFALILSPRRMFLMFEELIERRVAWLLFDRISTLLRCFH
jgi:hypothetical protein